MAAGVVVLAGVGRVGALVGLGAAWRLLVVALLARVVGCVLCWACWGRDGCVGAVAAVRLPSGRGTVRTTCACTSSVVPSSHGAVHASPMAGP